jgi:hypothetical protein
MLGALDHKVDAGRFIPFARWEPPAAAPIKRRFDTLFYVADAAQTASAAISADGNEAVAIKWTTAAAALALAAGAWGLGAGADEARKGFLLNHLIGEELPPTECGEHVSNSDPVTGQAAWFDVRVRVYKAGPQEPKISSPQFAAMPRLPGQDKRRGRWQAYVAGLFTKK